MHTKFFLSSFALALAAASESLMRSAEQYESLADGDDTDDAPQITPAEVAAAGEYVPQIPSAGVELDASGLPWHADIHASTKTKTAKGIWTKRKGVDDATVARVTAQLRASYPDTSVTEQPELPVATPAPVVAAPPIGIAAPVIAPPAAPLTGYAKLVDWLAKNTGAGKVLDQAWVDSMFATNGTSLAALAGQDAVADQYTESLRGVLASTGTAEVV